MKRIRGALAIMVMALAVTSVAAQSGSMKVKVVDAENQQPLPGATVVLSNAVQLISETATLTDGNGVADFPILRPGGGYIVQVTLDGYAGVRKDEIRVGIGDEQIITIPLGEEITQVEKVVAARDVVELEKTSVTTNFGDEFIQDLPVQGRFYTNVLTLAPGVQDSDGDGNPNVHGARERDFATIVGGVSNVDPLTGLRLSNINIDSIEEIEVITAGAGVEYGRAQGGFANIIEKQGSNEFEGLFNFVFRSSVLDGNGATNLTGNRVPDFDWLQPAIHVSGPIIKDKLWYRFSHEYLKREDPVNTLSSLAVTTTTRTTNSDMITWQVSRRNKLAFSFLHDPQTIENVGVSSNRPPEASWTIKVGGPQYRLAWTAPYSPKLLVDSLVAYQDAALEILPSSQGVPNNCIQGLALLTQSQCFDLVTGQRSGSFFITHKDRRQRLTVRTEAEIFGGRFLGMSHQFKLGFVVENERYFRSLNRRPDMSFFVLTNIDDPSDPGGSIEQVGIVNARVAVPAFSLSRAVGTNWAFFVNDQIKPLSNLTISLGARVDREIISSNGLIPFDAEGQSDRYISEYTSKCGQFNGSCSIDPTFNPNALLQGTFTAYENVADFVFQLAGQLGIGESEAFTKLAGPAAASTNFVQRRQLGNINITNTNVSPHLSVSWDPFRSGKTKLAATVGRHYDKIFLNIPLVELEPVTTDLNFRAQLRDGAWRVNNACGGTGACINPAVNVSTVDRNLRTPYQDEFTLTFERELAAETSIAVTYIRRKFRDQYQDIDLNHAPRDFGRCNYQIVPGDPVLLPSPGTGAVIDVIGPDGPTGETFIDTDPGDGDGRFDDCVGEFVQPENDGPPQDPPPGGAPVSAGLFMRPDGIEDAYILNPAWGEIFLIGNFNTADYEAYEVVLNRRQYRNWQLNASYVYSKAVGDAEDFNQVLGDDRSTIKDEFGYLSFDQRHVAKVNATTIVPWAGGFRFGGTVQWQSGFPYSIRKQDLSIDAVPPLYNNLGAPDPRSRLRYVTGQRNDQRNEGWWDFSVHVAKEMNLRGGMNLQITGDIFNLLNDDTLRVFNQTNGFNGSVRRFGRRFQVGLRLAF